MIEEAHLFRRLFLVAGVVLVAVVAHSQGRTHLVVSGDTIYSLAREYGVAQEDLMAANDLNDPRRLRAGMRLTIPGHLLEGKEPGAATDVFEYTVEEGDSLWELALTYGTSVAVLRRLNNFDSDDFLRIGQVIEIPAVVRTDPARAGDLSEDGELGAEGADGTAIRWPHPGARNQISGRLVGVEIAGVDGDEVRAVASGVVRFAQSFGIYGKVAIVQSENGYFYLYGGQTDLLISIGERIEPGDVLGLIGPIGAQQARTVFSVWFNSRFVDPNVAPRG